MTNTIPVSHEKLSEIANGCEGVTAVAPEGWVLVPRDIAIRARNAAESYISNPEVRDSLVRELNERISSPSPATGVRVSREDELIAALKPFAALGQYLIDQGFVTKPDDAQMWGFDGIALTYGDFRTAASALVEQP